MNRAKHKITIAAGTLFIGCLILLMAKMNSPFGGSFWLAFYGVLIGLLSLFAVLGIHLIQKEKRVLKILAFLPILMAFIGSVLLLVASWDYRLLLPMTSANPLSVELYQQDIDYLESILPSHPGYTNNIEGASGPIFRELKQASKSHDRDAFVFGVIRLIGLFQDGHSYVPPFQIYNQTRYLPLSGFYFEDGFYILSAANEYEALVNKQLLAINGVSIEDIFKEVLLHTGPENQWNAKSRLNFYLFSSNFLHSLGTLEDNRSAHIQYLDEAGIRQEISVHSEPFFNWLF